MPQPGETGDQPRTGPDEPDERDHTRPAALLDQLQDDELREDDRTGVGGEGETERGGGDARCLRTEGGQTRLELSVAGEEHHEAQHAQLHHGPVPQQPLPAAATRLRRVLRHGVLDARHVGQPHGGDDTRQHQEHHGLDAEQQGEAPGPALVDDLTAEETADAQTQVLHEELEGEGTGPGGRRGTPDDHRGQGRLHHGLTGTERQRGQQDGHDPRGEPERERAGRCGDGGTHDHGHRTTSVDDPTGEGQRDEGTQGEGHERARGGHGAQTSHLRHIDVEERNREADAERGQRVPGLDPPHRSAHHLGHFSPALITED